MCEGEGGPEIPLILPGVPSGMHRISGQFGGQCESGCFLLELHEREKKLEGEGERKGAGEGWWIKNR